MNRPVALDYMLLAGVGLIWGSQFSLNALAIQSVPPLTVAAARIFIGFITLSAIVAFLPKPPASVSRNQPWGLYCGIALAEAILPCFLIPWGQQHVDSSIAAILLATVPIFTLVLAPFFVKEERWGLVAALSALIGFFGVVVLVAPSIKGNWITNIVGELAILTGALSFSLSLIMMKRLSDIPPVLAMRNVFLVATIPLVVLALSLDAPWRLNFSEESIVALLGLGVFCGGIAYVMFIYMVNRTGPTFTALVGYLVTLVGVSIGIIYLGDQFQRHDIIAVSLIIGALVISRFKKDVGVEA